MGKFKQERLLRRLVLYLILAVSMLKSQVQTHCYWPMSFLTDHTCPLDLSCETCAKQKKFDRSLSSTFRDYNESFWVEFATGVGVDPNVSG